MQLSFPTLFKCSLLILGFAAADAIPGPIDPACPKGTYNVRDIQAKKSVSAFSFFLEV